MKKIVLSKIFKNKGLILSVGTVVFILLLTVLIKYSAEAASIIPTVSGCTIQGVGSINLDSRCDGIDKDVIITGPIAGSDYLTVVVQDQHTFRNLTIENKAILTHARFGDTEDPISSSKKIDIDIRNNLNLKNGGKISADGKGFVGGHGDNNGKGPGGGIGAGGGLRDKVAGGGGSFIGKGGNGSACNHNGDAGNKYTQSVDSLNVGSGGGGANASLYSVAGGGGGGRIKLNIQNSLKILSSNSLISANGNNGERKGNNLTSVTGGAGSAGSIWLEANEIEYNFSTATSLAEAGIGGTGATDGDADINISTGSKYVDNITAGGGSSPQSYGRSEPFDAMKFGGAGGGGWVHVKTNKVTRNDPCILTSGSTAIPDLCGKDDDIVIDGAQINIDAVRINQETNKFCNDASDPKCDSKRYFKSLIIKNHGLMTHSAISYNDMKDDSDNDSSLVDENASRTRWKKVDIKIDNDIKLESGGKIDVSGKGYPGGYYRCWNNNTSVGTGYGYIKPSNSKTYGWGPGGGLSYIKNIDYSDAGGGGFAGNGGAAFAWKSKQAEIGMSYSYKKDDRFEWGSGGGASASVGEDDVTVQYGGSGGGIIHLKINSGKLIFNDVNIYRPDIISQITSRGQNGIDMQNENNDVHGGGGSGGVIYIEASETIYYPSSIFYSVSGGLKAGEKGLCKLISDNSDCTNSILQLIAKGGNKSNSRYGYGRNGGGGGGGYIFAPPVITLSGSRANLWGDVYGEGEVYLPDYWIDDYSIVASKTNITINKATNQIPNYLNIGEDINWTNLEPKIEKHINQLINEQAKTLPETLNDPFYLQSDDGSGGNDTTKVEGGVWYTPGNLILPSTYFSGRGTIIVNGDLRINGDIGLSIPEEDMVGFIVKGNIFLGPNAHSVQAILYAHGVIGGARGNITVNSSGSSDMQIKGMLAASGSVTVPESPTDDSYIHFDDRFLKNPLPGFRKLQEVVLKEAAP